jgi:hypothetical protein
MMGCDPDIEEKETADTGFVTTEPGNTSTTPGTGTGTTAGGGTSTGTGTGTTSGTGTGSTSATGTSTGTTSGIQQPPAPEDLEVLFDRARLQATQSFELDGKHGGQIEGEDGTSVKFYENSFVRPDGEPVEGVVVIELIEAYRKAEMVLVDVPTNGLNDAGEVQALISGGEIYLNASQGGEPVELSRSVVVEMPTDNTGGTDTRMAIFTLDGEVDGPDAIGGREVWVEEKADGDDGGLGIGRDTDATSVGAGEQYTFLTTNLGWSNIDRWYNDPRPKTSIEVDVPDGWDETNCMVYLSYDGENGLARFDMYSSTTELFSEHYGLIPIDLNVHVIFVTESEGMWSYAIKGETIVENHRTNFDDPSEFIETDEDGLLAVLGSLP